jgi:putative ATP-dependent endonuclease of OLD family
LVEGDAENLLLPSIAALLDRPLEDYGVSIINIGNTGWKHFAKLFLRKGKDAEVECWNPIKVAVLRDLDLWPSCAEEKTENPYGFKTRKDGNAQYWESGKDIAEHKANLKKDEASDTNSLERQNISVQVSDKWTFEYCLSYFGLFDECYEALNRSRDGKDGIVGTEEEKSTYIQKEVNKSDFATQLALILEKNYQDKSAELRKKLPPYIVAAIEHVTAPLPSNEGEGGSESVTA